MPKRSGSPIRCEICGEVFSTNNCFGRHVKKHGHDLVSYFAEFCGLKIPSCPICGKGCKIKSGLTFCKTCGDRGCSERIRNIHIEETNLKRYGVRRALQSEHSKLKFKKTCRKNHGVEWPGQSKQVQEKREQTVLKKYGCTNVFQSDSVKEKMRNTFRRNLGVDWSSKSEVVREKQKLTLEKKWGVSSPMLSSVIREKAEQTNLKRRNVKYPGQSEECKKKKQKTMLDKYGVEHALQTPESIEKFKRTCKRNNGCDWPAQNPEIHKKVFSHRKEKYGGFLSKSERVFSEMLLKRGIDFVSPYFVNGKNFDFGVFDSDGNLKCLVEIDGEFCHGLLSDYDGKHVQGKNDHTRFRKVPAGVNFVVVDSLKVKEENIDEILKVAFMDHEEFIQNILDNLPAEFPFPSFDEKRMLKDWKHLCEWEPNQKQMLCNSVILNFCRSIWSKSVEGKPSPIEAWNDKTLLEKLVREHYIYWSKFSSKQISDGFNDCEIAPRFSFTQPSANRHKFSKSDMKVIEEELDVGRMLGACSLGLEYHGYSENKELVVEAINIIQFLGLGSNVSIKLTT